MESRDSLRLKALALSSSIIAAQEATRLFNEGVRPETYTANVSQTLGESFISTFSERHQQTYGVSLPEHEANILKDEFLTSVNIMLKVISNG
jgi:hypothetical protein